MDPRLAELYGTNQPDESDVEKLAAAQLAEDLSEDGEIDLDNVSEEDLEQLAQSVLEEGGEEAEEEGEEEEGEEKLAEADFLGRVMAHAYVQEMRNIETDGVEKQAGLKDFARKAGGKAKSIAKSVGGVLSGKEARQGLKGRSLAKKVEKSARTDKGHKGDLARRHILSQSQNKGGWEGVKSRFNRRALRGGAKTTGAYTGIVGTGYGAKKVYDKTKEGSALETLAMQRAEEILAENGVEAQTEVNPYDVLGAAVERRAEEILSENGYELQDGE